MVGNDNYDHGSGGNRSTSIRRRDVLRSSVGLAVGTAGAAAMTGNSSATLEALIEAGRCSGEDAWLDAPADYPVVDLQSSTPTQVGDWPDDPDELTIFVHGLGGDSNVGWKRQAYTFEHAAADSGWETPQVAALYTTSGDSLDWSVAVDLATTAGQRLAAWLRAYDSQNDVSTYTIVAHSLGGHVTGTLLNELDGDVVIDNVALLGPAIPTDSVCEDGQYGGGIQASAGSVNNYRSRDDAVVCDLYSSRLLGAGTDGIGCESPDCGWSGSTPSNFHDNDVTFDVDEHCDYPKADEGCVGRVVEDLQSDDENGGGDDDGDDDRWGRGGWW